jgi:NadR type nicotinamide-nucleotide adenylyltransferase
MKTIENKALKKIVIIGPESTGKSTLCEMLAQHFGTEWCPEFAREWLLTHGTNYDFEDLLTIARGQLALEDEYAGMLTACMAKQPMQPIHPLNTETIPPLLFVDTDMYVMKVWCEYVFNDCHTWILNRIAERCCDMYLLCKPDLPWVKDELREYPEEKPRQELYHMYRDLLSQQAVPWAEISGDYHERLQKGVDAIHAMVWRELC